MDSVWGDMHHLVTLYIKLYWHLCKVRLSWVKNKKKRIQVIYKKPDGQTRKPLLFNLPFYGNSFFTDALVLEYDVRAYSFCLTYTNWYRLWCNYLRDSCVM